MTDHEPDLPHQHDETDQPHQPDELDPSDELDPAQEAAVRSLLADARHTDPVPDHVAERLDRVLVGLAGERRTPASQTTLAPVTPMSRHRRRRAAQLLVAAAAVVVAGVGFAQLVDGMGAGESDNSSATFERDAPESASNDDSALDAGGDQSSTSPESSSSTTPSSDAGAQRELDELPVIRPSHLQYDLRAATSAKAQDLLRADLAEECPIATGTAEAAAKQVAVNYEGGLAQLVYHAPRGDVQRVDLYRCDPPGLIRSIVIPTP